MAVTTILAEKPKKIQYLKDLAEGMYSAYLEDSQIQVFLIVSRHGHVVGIDTNEDYFSLAWEKGSCDWANTEISDVVSLSRVDIKAYQY